MKWFPFLEKRPAKPKSRTRETIETFVVALALALGVRATIAEARYIPSGSMLPTLQIGDRLIIEKVTYHFEPPQRDDIVVFTPPKSAGFPASDALIKRVIGLPGDHVAVHDGKVWINGKALYEPYIEASPDYDMPDPNDPDAYFHTGKDVVVPKGDVFVMGDNRNDSADSHIWGFLPIKDIIGRSVFRFWPPNRIGPTT